MHAVRTNATYVYCLVQSAKAPSVRGVPGQRSRRRRAAAPRDRSRCLGCRRGCAARALRRRGAAAGDAGRREPFRAMRSRTPRSSSFSSAARRSFRSSCSRCSRATRRLAATCAAGCAPLKRMFAALRGLEEWGVRIIAGEVEAESARTLDSGRDYLQVKKRLHEQTVAPPRATMRAVEWRTSTRSAASRRRRGRKHFRRQGEGARTSPARRFSSRRSGATAWKKQAARARAQRSRAGSPARNERPVAAVSFRQQIDGSPQETAGVRRLAVPES